MNKLASISLRFGITLDLGSDGRWTSDEPVVASIANHYMESLSSDYRPNFYKNVAEELAKELGGTVTYAVEAGAAPQFDDDGNRVEY